MTSTSSIGRPFSVDEADPLVDVVGDVDHLPRLGPPHALDAPQLAADQLHQSLSRRRCHQCQDRMAAGGDRYHVRLRIAPQPIDNIPAMASFYCPTYVGD